MSEALKHKEGAIAELERELNMEKERRKDMTKNFNQCMNEFKTEQKALSKIHKATEAMQHGRMSPNKEAARLKKNILADDSDGDQSDLDRVPVRETSKNSARKTSARRPAQNT